MAYAQAPQNVPMNAPSGKPKRPTWHWLLLGGVALIGLLIVAVFAVFIGWKILSRGNPENTLGDFYSSLQEADCDLFLDSTTDDFQQATGLTSCSAFDENIAGVSGVTYEVTDRTNRQGYAIFDVTETFSADGQSESVEMRYYVRRIDGQWDVDGFEKVDPGSEPIT
jgi:hypothetical protein